MSGASQPITATELDELERIAKLATPGPWRVDEDGDLRAGGPAAYLRSLATLYAPIVDDDDSRNDADVAFIAAARDALPRLIAQVRELENRLDLADQRTVALMRMTAPVCFGCNGKRTGTHCADCRGELFEDGDGITHADGVDHA